MDSNSLIPVETVNAIELFTGGNSLDDLLARIRQETATVVPDVSTDKGRKEIASLAYKVARSKTTIDDAGKTLVTEWKAKSAQVDASRKRARDYLDALKDEVRKPLTDWEEEQERIKQEAIDAERRAVEQAEAARRAELERKETELRAREEAIAKAEADARAKAQAEQAERDRVTREEQIRREAAEKAERDAAEAVARAEREAAEAKERERLAAERAEREKQEAVSRAEERARREAEEREKARIAEEARVRAEEACKAANRSHRAKVNNEVMKALVKAGCDEKSAKAIVIAIAGDHIPHTTINY